MSGNSYTWLTLTIDGVHAKGASIAQLSHVREVKCICIYSGKLFKMDFCVTIKTSDIFALRQRNCYKAEQKY